MTKWSFSPESRWAIALRLFGVIVFFVLFWNGPENVVAHSRWWPGRYQIPIDRSNLAFFRGAFLVSAALGAGFISIAIRAVEGKWRIFWPALGGAVLGAFVAYWCVPALM